MALTLLVDETKQRRYIVVACAVRETDMPIVRAAITALTLRGTSSPHMSKERDARKRQIADAVSRLPIGAYVYDARDHLNERSARTACLEALIEDAWGLGARRLVLDRDESLVRPDNRVLFEKTLQLGCRDVLRYEHRHRREQPLLTLPDVVAWCWAKGGHWASRVAPVVNAVRRV